MKRIYLVHCWDGKSSDGSYPWLASQLNNDNIEVVLLDMPNSSTPSIEEWVNTLNNKVENLNKDSYFIGHSIGCQTIMRYLQTKDITKIGGILFVAPWFNLLPKAIEEKESYHIAYPWIHTPIHLEKIKQFTNNIHCIFSSDDYFVSLNQEKEFKDQLNANTIVVHNKGHISQDDHVYELEEILEYSRIMLESR